MTDKDRALAMAESLFAGSSTKVGGGSTLSATDTQRKAIQEKTERLKALRLQQEAAMGARVEIATRKARARNKALA